MMDLDHQQDSQDVRCGCSLMFYGIPLLRLLICRQFLRPPVLFIPWH